MNLSQLRTFVTVVEHGSFSSAARVMHLSQPAVTMQIQALEADLGVTLLDRAYRKVEATEAGRALLPYARRVLHELELARGEIEAIAETATGHLRLAASTTPGQYLLPRLLGAFVARFPEVTVSLAVADTARVVEAVENGEADLGMTGAEIPGAKAHFERACVDELVLVCPPEHPLARERGVALATAVEEPFIMREEGSGTRLVTEEALRLADIDPGDLDVVMELGTGEAIVSAVEGGLGLAVLSRLVVGKALELGTVAAVDCPHFPIERPLFTVTGRSVPTRAAEEFAAHLGENLTPPSNPS